MENPKIPQRLIDSYEKAITQDYIGLWEIISDAKTTAKANNAATIQAATLDLVSAMLSRGFRAGYLAEAGGFEDWSDQDPNSVVRRIKAEWDELGREPDISDICWFNRD